MDCVRFITPNKEIFDRVLNKLVKLGYNSLNGYDEYIVVNSNLATREKDLLKGSINWVKCNRKESNFYHFETDNIEDEVIIKIAEINL